MSKVAIKICGIRDPDMAKEAVLAGADFIGIIFHPPSKRCVSIAQATDIAKAAKALGATPVAVFVDHSSEEMAQICQETDIQIVQLHGDRAKSEHHQLPAHYRRIYVQSVAANGTLDPDEAGGLSYCHPIRDYLLFDNREGGKGQPFDWEAFHYKGTFPWGLAGGLTIDNVKIALKKYPLALVDVSSGVERAHGEKDKDLIRQFIHTVRPVRQAGDK
jgi:phosphoribosylanthranilate isomerase